MKIYQSILTILGIVALSGCKTTGAASPVDAIILSHTQESIQELTKIISSALNKPVTLTQHAFAKSNRIAIEPSTNTDIRFGVIDGKQIEKPPIFELTMVGELCQLSYADSGETWTLKSTKCVPKPTKE